MKGGFTYKGVDIEDLGLTYAPEINDTFVYRPTGASVHEETYDGHDGGYYYGVTRQPKEFILRCFFEEENVNSGIMSKVYSLFRRGSFGPLVFKRRPWCYYSVVITDVKDDLTNYLNGLITITAKAYYPFARSNLFFIDRMDQNYESIINNTGVLPKATMVPPTSFIFTGQTQEQEFLLFNPGTERAALGIKIAGDSISGVKLINETTQEECKYVALTKAATSDKGKYVFTDPINGKTTLRSAETSEINFLYHDYGFLSLQPSYPALRNVMATFKDGQATVQLRHIIYDPRIETKESVASNYIGRYIYLPDSWYEIAEIVDSTHIKLKKKYKEPVDSEAPPAGVPIDNSPVSYTGYAKAEYPYVPGMATAAEIAYYRENGYTTGGTSVINVIDNMIGVGTSGSSSFADPMQPYTIYSFTPIPTITVSADGKKTMRTIIVTMNKIHLKPIANDTALTMLSFVYKPTYS